MDMNKVFITGRLTKDAELKHLTNNTPVCSFSIASNYRKKTNGEYVNEVNYFDAVIFGKMADTLFNYLEKGKQLAVFGTIRQERWKDNNGKDKEKIRVYVEEIQFFGDRKTTENNNTEYGNIKPNNNTTPPLVSSPDGLVGPEAFEDDGIPF